MKYAIHRKVFFVLVSLFLTNSSAQEKQPNLLFIEVDDLNYEYLSSFGNTLVHTPNVDKLAAQGVRFTNAVAQGMMCGPSRNSLMTGMYPHNLGFYKNGDLKALPKGIWTLPQGLQNSGYATAWIGKCHIRPAGKDKTQAMKELMGFDFVQQTEGRVVITKKAKKRPKEIDKDWYLRFLKERNLVDKFLKEYPKITSLPEDAYLDAFFTANAQDYLNNYKSDKPFFLWLNYSVPHGPNDVYQKYHDPYDVDKMPGTNKPDFKAPEKLVKGAKLDTDENKHKKLQAGHCAMVSFMDVQVGRILETLEKNKQLENTIIVFFSDHGIMMGDHQRQHKGTLYRQITNPSLIISYPKEYMKNVAVDSPVELIDLVQTSLEIANAPKKELKKRTYSKSLVPLLTGKKKKVRKTAFAEIEGYTMATDGRYRLIKGKDATLLFNDKKDPKNLHNIADQNTKRVKELSKNIDNWLTTTGEPLPAKSY